KPSSARKNTTPLSIQLITRYHVCRTYPQSPLVSQCRPRPSSWPAIPEAFPANGRYPRSQASHPPKTSSPSQHNPTRDPPPPVSSRLTILPQRSAALKIEWAKVSASLGLKGNTASSLS